MEKPKVLVVDDELSIRYVLENLLERKRVQVETAASAEEALELLSDHEPEVALVDIVLPGRSGIDLLADIKQWNEDCQVVMITCQGSVETAVGAMRLGAFDYLRKPFGTLDEVWETVRRALDKRARIRERRRHERQVSHAVVQLGSLLNRPSDPDHEVGDTAPDEPVVRDAADVVDSSQRS